MFKKNSIRRMNLVGSIFPIGFSMIILLTSTVGTWKSDFNPTTKIIPDAVNRMYVATSGDGTDPYGGWRTAYPKLQDALLVANIGGGGEIWVAAGVYYPDEGVYQINNVRNSTFSITNNVKLYGGFDTNDKKFSDRDWKSNVTILSGDIDGNDDTNGEGVVTDKDNINGNNAFHVVTATNGNITGILDGFTITAGQANNLYPNNRGGGFLCDGANSSNECSPFLSNITFSGNLANQKGGAMHNSAFEGHSSPILNNVTFSGNWAYYGGAMFNDGRSNGISSPSLTNVIFSSNTGFFDGGAVFNDGETNGISSPTMINVAFIGNSAGTGGAMYNNGKSNGNSSPSLTNVSFSGNFAEGNGGAMYNYCYGVTGSIKPILTNVTFSGNSAESGGAIFNLGNDGGTTSLQVRNSILWNNQDRDESTPRNNQKSSSNGTVNTNILNYGDATVSLSFSLAQGTGGNGNWKPDSSIVDGGNNIDRNPLFIKPINPSNAPTTTGNLRLKSGSPAINDGNNGFVTADFDLDGNARIMDGIVDMGAYEFQIQYIYDSYLPLILN